MLVESVSLVRECSFALLPSFASAADDVGGLSRRLLFVAACVALPVTWGVVVNWLFDLWRRRSAEVDEDRIFPDYQI